MNYTFCFAAEPEELEPFTLYRDRIRPNLERGRAALDAMYDPRLGRPEIDPVLLMGICLFQIMERLPDRQAIRACCFDVRWRLGLALPADWEGVHPTTLSYFRERLSQHGQARLSLDACLEAMQSAGYLKARGPVRIDSTHMLAQLADMSRMECVRETLRLALDFLSAFDGPSAWEPWHGRYADRHPKELRHLSAERIRTTMEQAGRDCQAVLAKAAALGEPVRSAYPVRLLQRVFDEQFEVADGAVAKRRSSAAGAVQNPHDPEATWSTKNSLGSEGWVGYKIQVCETVVPGERPKGEPTPAVITAVLAQTATASDHGSIEPVLEEHAHARLQTPDTVYVDAGYISAERLARAEEDGLEICGPMPAPPHGSTRFGSDAFDVDLPGRRAVCPAGVPSARCSYIKETYSSRSFYYLEWPLSACAACAWKPQCLSTRTRQTFRSLQLNEYYMHAQARRRACREIEYQKRMQQRSAIEGSISELKRGYGLRRARYRGRRKTELQAVFSAAACDLRRWSARIRWLNRKTA